MWIAYAAVTLVMMVSLLALHRWNDRPSGSRALLWGAAVTLQALTSWYLAVLVAVANTALLIALATQWRQGWGRRVAHVAAAAALVILCVWPFAREYLGLAPVLRSEAVSSSADAASYLVPPENTWPGRMWVARIAALLGLPIEGRPALPGCQSSDVQPFRVP